MTTISEFISENFFYVFLAVIALTLFQRKYGKRVTKKRMAVLYIAIIIFALQISASLIMEFEFTDAYLLIWAVAAGVIIYFKKGVIFPFKYKCVKCSATLTFNDMVFDDSNLCEKCREKEKALEDEESKESEE